VELPCEGGEESKVLLPPCQPSQANGLLPAEVCENQVEDDAPANPHLEHWLSEP